MAKTYNFLFEVTPLNGATPTTLRLTNISADSKATTANGQAWLPCITSMPDTGSTLSADGLLDDLKIERGEVSFFCSDDFTNHIWSSYVWNNAYYRAWYGENGNDFASYSLLGEGRTTNLERDGNQVTVRLLGPEADVTSKMLSNSYAGLGGAEGPLGFKGNLKPRCFGAPLSVEPVELDPVNLVYQVHGYGAVASIQPYEYGLPLEVDQFKGNAASYAALIALPLAPGEYATCLAEGMFRFGGTPTPKITADVTMSGGTTLADIATAILTAAGVPSNKIGSFTAVSTVQTNLYVTSQVEALEALQSLFKQAGCYLFADKNGVWQCGRFYASTKSAITLNSDRSTFPILLDWKEEPTKPPIKKVSYGFQRCWGVHSDSEASPIINELAQKAEENAYWENIKGDGKPEDNATVGAPEGTFVGDKPVEQVIDAITDANGNLIASEQLKADIEAAADLAQELQETYGSTASAAASASAAAQHEQNAETAASNAAQADSDAQAARDAANTAKDLAVSAKDGAAGFAQNSDAARAAAVVAKDAAELAKGQAQTFAGNSDSARAASEAAKTASQQARDQAQQYAANADGSASAASGHASTASTKANEAGQSASAAQASQISASTTAQSLMPPSFGDLRNWTWDFSGGTSDLAADGRFIAYDHGQLGRVLEVDNNPHFTPHIASKGRVALIRDHVYRITVKWCLGAENESETARTAAIYAIGFRPDGSQWNDIAAGFSVSPGQAGWGSTSWATHYLDVHSNTLLDQGVSWVRPLFRLDSQGRFLVQSIEFRDITGEYFASGSASAAANSASSAAISKSGAEQSASAAQQSATNASTSEGDAWDHRVAAGQYRSDAQTFRSEASQSASNAAGSASTAQQQAGLAANSANEAGQSAGAAAGSASTASSKASEASQSASAAQASQVSASATAQALMPATFGDIKNWSSDWGTATGSLADDPTHYSAYDHGSLGRILDVYNSPYFSPHIVPKGRVALVRDKVYRFTVKWALTGYQVSNSVSATLFFIGIKPNSSSTGDYWNNQNTTVQILEGQPGWGSFWATHTIDVLSNTLIDNGCQWTRPLLRIDSQGHYAVQSIEIRDITGEYNAVGAANAAAQSASSAAISKSGAEQSASAASGSATNAATSASQADQQRQAAYQQAANALQFRGEAETFRNQASQSASNASGSASTASEQAGLAANSAGQAAGSAGAAAGSASTASTKSNEAGQSANSASASANTASTKAGEAAGSASAAAGSASSAASSASQAGQSASAAQSAEVSATTAAQALMPATFQTMKNWTWDYRVGSSDLSGDNRWNAYDHGTLGRIVQINNNPHFGPHTAPKGRVALIRDHVYRITVKWALFGQQNGDVQQNAAIFAIGIRPDQSDWNNVNMGVSVSPGQAGWGSGNWATHYLDVHSNTLMDAGCAWVRPLFRLDNQGIYGVQSIEIRDITGEYNAVGAANAAAGSASTASIKANEAGQSASAANSSQTQAATSASNAKGSEDAAWNHRQGAAGHESNAWTYRNEASQSASNAAGSASTASQQAGLASNSANAAGQSASAAAGSASTASTKASEAGQSASAASSSQVTASNAAAGAQAQFAKTFPSFVGPIGKNAYDYVGDNGTGFTFEHGPDQNWPQPYITAQAGGQGARYNRITFKETMEKVVGRRYRVTGWFCNHGSNCEKVNIWLLRTNNNVWDGNASGHGGDAVAPDCVNNVPLNQGGFWKVGVDFTVDSSWPAKWKPVFEFQTTGGAPNGLWHMTGMTITDITSEKAAADSASAASSSYSNAQYEAGQAQLRASAASGSANTASIKAGEAQGHANAAAGSAATASEKASAASSSATLAATFSTGGGNLIPETTFAVGTQGWSNYAPDPSNISWERDHSGDDWRPTNEHNIGIRQGDSNQGKWAQWHADQISIRGGTWYEFSGYVAAHRCHAYMRIDWVDASGHGIKSDYNFNTNTADYGGGRDLNSWKICWGKARSPDNAARAHLIFVKDPTWAGQPDSYAWMCRPMVRQTYEQANGPSPYSAGSGALTATSQSASISQNQTAIATANNSLANLTTVVQSGSPNLLRNGGFNSGMTHWGQTHGGWSTGRGGWGQVANRGGDWSGNHTYIETEKMPIFGGAIYTLSADSVYFLNWGDGHCYTELVWFDSAGNYITQHSGNVNYANHDYSNSEVNRNIHRLTVASPGNATHCVARLVHYKGNASVNVIGWRQVKLEQNDKMTAYSNEASVTTIAETVTSVDGKANQALARAGVRLDVNGYVSGWETANNGQSADFNINADNFRILKPGGGARTEYSNGRWMATDGSSYMSVWGAPFGQGNRFLRWSGPYNGDLTSCHEGNAKEYLRVDGSMYFGGSLLAGSLRNSQGSSSTASNASTQIGPFGSNGGTITVNASWTYSFWTRQDYEASTNGLNAYNTDINNFGTQFLQDNGSGHSGSKSIGLSGSNLVMNLRRNGGVVASQAGGNGILSLEGYKPVPGDAWGWIKWTYNYSASFTYTDPDHNTNQRIYSVDIVRSGLGAGNETEQRVFVTSVEG